jgi:hypothetical protein
LLDCNLQHSRTFQYIVVASTKGAGLFGYVVAGGPVRQFLLACI